MTPKIELESPASREIAVGGGTAVFLRGRLVERGRRVRSLAIEHDGDAHPVTGFGLPHPDGGVIWWTVLPVDGVESGRSSQLVAVAVLAGGDELRIPLAGLSLRPEPGILYGEALREHRREASVAARKIARRHPVRQVVAIVMPIDDHDPEPLERKIEALRAQTHPAWVCIAAPARSGVRALEVLRRSAREDPRFVLCPSAGSLDPVSNLERALCAVPREAKLTAFATEAGTWHAKKLEEHVAQGDSAPSLTLSQAPQPPDVGALLLAQRIPIEGAVLRTDVLGAVLPFPVHDFGGDPGIWLALAAKSVGGVAVGDVLPAGHRATVSPTERAAPRDWEDVYFHEHCRALVAACALEKRLASRLSDGDRHSVEEVRAMEFEGAVGLRLRAIDLRLSRAPGARERRRHLHAVAVTRRKERRARIRRIFGRGNPVSVRRGERDEHAAAEEAEGGPAVPAAEGGPENAQRVLAIDVRDLRKTFQVPGPEPESLKSRLRRPFAIQRRSRLTVLDGISFQVERGECFGILGRNGSGKTTLLKLLAGIQGADSGTIRISPRVAPVIQLGVGFHPDFAALKNVVLNAEMMGLGEAAARRRFDEIIEFAGLTDFVDMKLRNYSSGMRARLAFSIATHVDADLLLLDEVLAVGDPAFQRKSERVFDERKKSRDLTIVLVTQQPAKTTRHCDRALLLEGGVIEMIGDPAEAARRYAELSLEGYGSNLAGPHTTASLERARIADLWLEDPVAGRVKSVHAGEGLRLHAAIEATADIEEPGLRLEIRNVANAKIFAPPTLELAPDRPPLGEGETVELVATIENKLAPGPYTINCTVAGLSGGAEFAVSRSQSVDFVVVSGPIETGGVIDLDYEVQVGGNGHRSAAERGAEL